MRKSNQKNVSQVIDYYTRIWYIYLELETAYCVNALSGRGVLIHQQWLQKGGFNGKSFD